MLKKIAYTASAFSLPLIAGAQTALGKGLMNPLKSSTLPELLTAVLGFVQTIGAIFVVLMLIYTGFQFVQAQGNSTKLQEARKTLLWTVLGALVLLGATAISLGIQETVKSL